MIKTVPLLSVLLLVSGVTYSQSNQEKAQNLVKSYSANHPGLNNNTSLKLGNLQIVKSSYTDTKQYKSFQHTIDSLKFEGRKIDAKIPKLKTSAEIDQAKKDSKHLSNQLVAISDRLIDFMTGYKSVPIGWTIKSINLSKKKTQTFYLDKELTQITLVK